MWRPSLSVRPEERRDVGTAFVFLVVFVGAHAALETGRDVLFLSKIPAAHLPFMMAAIAVVSLAVNGLQDRFARWRARRTLASMAVASSALTVALWASLPRLGDAGLYVLYVWAGVVTTLVLLRFWTLMGDLFTVGQAKRLFGTISTGAVLGAIGGSSIVTIFAGKLSASTFVLLGGAGFALAAAIPLLFSARADEGEPPEASAESWIGGLGASAGFVARHPYVLRVALMTGASATVLSLADLAFRTTIAQEIPKQHLATTFGVLTLTLNVVSLVVQLASGPILRKFSLPWVLAVLPALLSLGGVGLLVGGGVVAAFALKGADGSLRYSLNKTGTELLYLPLSETERKRSKAFLEVVATRGGQVVASAVGLGIAHLAIARQVSAAVVIVLALVWVALCLRLREPYLELFRATVMAGRRRLDAHPELDVAGLEALLQALDDESDTKVVSALAVLEREGKTNVVPTLILYHPGEHVVITALRMFARSKRRVALHAIGHLLEHSSARIRAEAVAARAVIDPEQRLSEHLEIEESPEVRAALIATMAADGAIAPSVALELLDRTLEVGAVASKVVVAEVVGWRKVPALSPLLVKLADDAEIEVRKAAVHALGHLGDADAADALILRLGDEPVRELASEGLVRAGRTGWNAAQRALTDVGLPKPVRWRIPQVLVEIDAALATPMLLAGLASEPDGMVRYRSLLALGWVQRNRAEVRFDRKLVDAEVTRTMSRGFRYLHRIVVLERAVADDASRRTEGHELLVQMLTDKQQNSVERVFRLLALRHPKHPFLEMHRSLESGDKNAHASVIELIENFLPSPVREGLVALVDEDTGRETRLAAGEEFHPVTELTYEDVLRQLLASTSEIVRDLAAYHVAEMHLDVFATELRALDASGRGTPDVARALDILHGAPSLRGSTPRLEIVHAR
jgi:AAA family ATP:ADP antiporter